MENKTLVAYFSASGVTAKAAESLAAACGGDLYEIKPAVPYTSKDLNWQDKRSRSSVEMNDPSARPEFADGNLNLTAYDRIFLGFPNWWYDMPMPIYSFLEEYDFSGKTIIPFVTSGGSGFSSAISTIEEMESGATVIEGISIGARSATGAQADVEAWLTDLGYLSE